MFEFSLFFFNYAVAPVGSLLDAVNTIVDHKQSSGSEPAVGAPMFFPFVLETYPQVTGLMPKPTPN